MRFPYCAQGPTRKFLSICSADQSFSAFRCEAATAGAPGPWVLRLATRALAHARARTRARSHAHALAHARARTRTRSHTPTEP
eukprot:475743-Pleurochrysis_carterae.AAC.1